MGTPFLHLQKMAQGVLRSQIFYGHRGTVGETTRTKMESAQTVFQTPVSDSHIQTGVPIVVREYTND